MVIPAQCDSYNLKWFSLSQHRKELVDAIHHGVSVLKADKMATSSQSRQPSYGTQVSKRLKRFLENLSVIYFPKNSFDPCKDKNLISHRKLVNLVTGNCSNRI